MALLLGRALIGDKLGRLSYLIYSKSTHRSSQGHRVSSSFYHLCISGLSVLDLFLYIPCCISQATCIISQLPLGSQQFDLTENMESGSHLKWGKGTACAYFLGLLLLSYVSEARYRNHRWTSTQSDRFVSSQRKRRRADETPSASHLAGHRSKVLAHVRPCLW